MILTEENREEALNVLRFVGVEEERLKYMECTDDSYWTHKFEGHLGGRDGWSGLIIDRGPDYEIVVDDYATPEQIVVNGVEYVIVESD